MRRAVLLSALCAGLMLASTDTALAHGGAYRGPGDVVPPHPGGGGHTPGPGPGGPLTPGPGRPSVPGPGNPSTPGPGGPSGGPGGFPGGSPVTPGGGSVVGSDLTRWQFWWEFNKNPYINLKEAIHAGAPVTGSDEVMLGGHRRSEAIDTLAPTDSQIEGTVVPALARALAGSDNRDMKSACLVALGKIGRNVPAQDIDVLALMREHLRSHDQEIRETAALAMGISQMPAAIPTLIALATDSPAGRQLCDRPSGIDYRTRSFACYGLGLVAYATANTDSKRDCFVALATVLDQATAKDWPDRNLPVAAIHGIRLIRPNPDAGAKERELLDMCVDKLWKYYERKLGPGDQQIQSHVPTAVADLVGCGGAGADRLKKRFLGELRGEFGKRNNNIYQAAAIALGKLAQPRELEPDDAVYSAALLDYAHHGRDEQTRYLALISLGRIGGDDNRAQLLRTFASGSKALVKPWAALALGVLQYERAKLGRTDETIGRALRGALHDLKNDQTLSAIAIALGLCKYTEAAPDLEALLERYAGRDEFAGYLCVGLALMNHRGSTELIRHVAERSLHRPALLQQAAIALGKLGDKRVAIDLQRMLAEPDQNIAKLAAISSALGFIGDRRTVDPLRRMLVDDSITPLSQAFAAAALGGVADKEALPWSTKISIDINYRAAVETLTQSGSGVLDIL